MPLPHLLLVDDSAAILAYETAVLSNHYAISTAIDGQDALRKVRELLPAAVLLDLSMPDMDGDEVLARMKADPQLATIPVIIISTEKQRGEACVRAGASAFLPKPIEAEELQLTVGRVLEEAAISRRAGELAVLFLVVSDIEIGLPLEAVRAVVLQPATRQLPLGPPYLREMFDFHGQPVCVLDLARKLGVRHTQPFEERRLVIVGQDRMIALSADHVCEPEIFLPDEVTWRDVLGGGDHAPLRDSLVAVVRSSRGPLPILDPLALLSQELLDGLTASLASLAAVPASPARPAT